ncbi:hypothetical protein RI054_12g60780 [Pseudoscourfieldia marina]
MAAAVAEVVDAADLALSASGYHDQSRSLVSSSSQGQPVSSSPSSPPPSPLAGVSSFPPPRHYAPFTPETIQGFDWGTVYELMAKVLLVSATTTAMLTIVFTIRRRRRQPLRAQAPWLLAAQVLGAWLMASHVLLAFAFLPNPNTWCDVSRMLASTYYVLLDVPLALRTWRLVHVFFFPDAAVFRSLTTVDPSKRRGGGTSPVSESRLCLYLLLSVAASCLYASQVDGIAALRPESGCRRNFLLPWWPLMHLAETCVFAYMMFLQRHETRGSHLERLPGRLPRCFSFQKELGITAMLCAIQLACDVLGADEFINHTRIFPPVHDHLLARGYVALGCLLRSFGVLTCVGVFYLLPTLGRRAEGATLAALAALDLGSRAAMGASDAYGLTDTLLADEEVAALAFEHQLPMRQRSGAQVEEEEINAAASAQAEMAWAQRSYRQGQTSFSSRVGSNGTSGGRSGASAGHSIGSVAQPENFGNFIVDSREQRRARRAALRAVLCEPADLAQFSVHVEDLDRASWSSADDGEPARPRLSEYLSLALELAMAIDVGGGASRADLLERTHLLPPPLRLDLECWLTFEASADTSRTGGTDSLDDEVAGERVHSAAAQRAAARALAYTLGILEAGAVTSYLHSARRGRAEWLTSRRRLVRLRALQSGMVNPSDDAAELHLSDDALASDLESAAEPGRIGRDIQLSLWAQFRDGVDGLWWRVWSGLNPGNSMSSEPLLDGAARQV